MRPLNRPPNTERDRWVNLDQTCNAKAHVATQIAQGASLNSDDFKSAWTEKRWADAIATAQDGQCAWCTRKPADGGHVGVIDHVRPRAEVTRDIESPGISEGPRDHAVGRALLPKPPLRPGYHWLAYDPDNLVYSCERCNTGWKKTLWPVAPWHDSASWCAPKEGVPEDELVLDPFESGFHPLQYFCFGLNGAMLPRSQEPRAEATIAVFALDGVRLCGARADVHKDVEICVNAILRALRSSTLDEGQIGMLRRFAERCAWSSPHAAFYRVVLRRELVRRGVSWVHLRALWGACGLAGDIDEPPDDSWID